MDGFTIHAGIPLLLFQIPTEPVKLELQQARGEGQSLVAARQGLISKVQQLAQDLQRSHSNGVVGHYLLEFIYRCC